MKDKPRFFYGWIVVIGCFFAMLASGIYFYSHGVFFKPLEDEFGWNRASISLAFTIYVLASAPGSYLGGRLAGKFGIKVPIALAAVFTCAGMCLLSQTQSLWHLYICAIPVGLGLGSIWPITLATVQRWFMKLRGLVLGINMAGTGLGAMAFATLSDHFISSYGWRTSYIILGLIAGSIFALAFILISTNPEDKGLKPYGAEDISAEEEKSADSTSKVWTTQIWSTREALKSRAFWFLCILYITCLMPAYIFSNHFVRHCIDAGIAEAIAASALGLVGLISIAGRIGTGGTADRLGWKITLSSCSFIMAASLFWLIGINNLWMLYLFVVIYGFFYGGRITTLPGMIGFFFGTSSLSEIMGIILAIGTAGGCLGPYIAGYIFDQTGSYAAAFSMAAILCIVAGIIVLILKPPHKSNI